MYIIEQSSDIKLRAKVVQNQSNQSRSLPRHFKLSPHSPGVARHSPIMTFLKTSYLCRKVLVLFVRQHMFMQLKYS